MEGSRTCWSLSSSLKTKQTLRSGLVGCAGPQGRARNGLREVVCGVRGSRGSLERWVESENPPEGLGRTRGASMSGSRKEVRERWWVGEVCPRSCWGVSQR